MTKTFGENLYTALARMNKTLFKRTDQIDHFLRELFQSNQISIIRRNVSSMTKEL